MSHTRDRILDAARKKLSHNPNATIDEIAAEARVGRATVFRLFSNRTDLLKTLARNAIEVADGLAMQAATEATSAVEALRLVIVAVVKAGEHFRFLGGAAELSDDEEIEQAYQRQLSALGEQIMAAQAEGAIRTDLPKEWLVASIDGLIWSAVDAVAKGTVGILQAQEYLWETVMTGFATKATPDDK